MIRRYFLLLLYLQHEIIFAFLKTERRNKILCKNSLKTFFFGQLKVLRMAHIKPDVKMSKQTRLPSKSFSFTVVHHQFRPVVFCNFAQRSRVHGEFDSLEEALAVRFERRSHVTF